MREKIILKHSEIIVTDLLKSISKAFSKAVHNFSFSRNCVGFIRDIKDANLAHCSSFNTILSLVKLFALYRALPIYAFS